MPRPAVRPICLLLGAWMVAAASAQGLPAPIPPDPGGLVRVALGLIEYTRWPGPPRERRLCLATAGPFGRDLQAALRAEPDRLQRLLPRDLPVDTVPPDDCDVLVMGGWQDGAARSVLAVLDGRPVLTIGMGAAACAQGAQFCLLPRPPAPAGAASGPALAPRFASVADAIRRSGLVISSRVLQLARPAEVRP
jgi:hypothetical protein